jgi:hypothetical protein
MRIYNNTGQLIELHTSEGVKLLSPYGTLDAGDEVGSSQQVRYLAAADKIRLEPGARVQPAAEPAPDDEEAAEPAVRGARKRSVPSRHR